MKINLATAVHWGVLFHGGSWLTVALVSVCHSVVSIHVLPVFSQSSQSIRTHLMVPRSLSSYCGIRNCGVPYLTFLYENIKIKKPFAK